MQLSNKLLGQGCVKEHLKSFLRKSYGGYGDLIKQYEAPSPECYMAFWRLTIHSDILDWSDITPILDLVTDLDLITEFDHYLIVRASHRTFASDAACQQRTLTPPDTWFCPSFGLACVLMLIPISPELVLFPDFWASNIPLYFCFASMQSLNGSSVNRTELAKTRRSLLILWGGFLAGPKPNAAQGTQVHVIRHFGSFVRKKVNFQKHRVLKWVSRLVCSATCRLLCAYSFFCSCRSGVLSFIDYLFFAL